MSGAFDERYRFDNDGNLVIKREADLTGHWEACHALRQETPEHGKFTKGFLHRVASIPAIVAMEWRNEGIDIFDTSPEMQKRILKKINQDMPELKTMNVRL